MAFVLFAFVFMFVGMFAYALLMKHGGALARSLSGLSRFSSPYNALVTFGLCLVLFLLGHNRLPSALGGALVVVGAVTVLGLAVRAVRAALAHLGGVRVPMPVRRKKVEDGYWDFVDGQWVEVEREVKPEREPQAEREVAGGVRP